MDMKRWIFLVFSVVILFACNEPTSTTTDNSAVKKMENEDIANIIRNPVSAEEEIDPDFVPKITFKKVLHDFGEMKEGDKKEYTFEFTNTGEVPLLISNARSTCGCTVPKFTKNYVKPGKSGEINVAFDSHNLIGAQTKPITIIANTYPRETVIHIKSFVNPSKNGGGHEGHNH